MLYRYRAGIPWRDLPARFGDFRVVHTRFSRWSKTGVWERVFEHLAEDADNEYAMIDSTIVRAHQHSAGALHGGAKPRSKALLNASMIFVCRGSAPVVAPKISYPNSATPQEAIGQSKGGLSTKIHAVVDALGNPRELSPHLWTSQ